jgi:glycosyltransferase involved in cell wall biosynthesis
MKGLITFIEAYKGLDNTTKEKLGEIFLVSHDNLSVYDTQGMNIIIPKNDTEIANVYKSSDIFISTSWWEGFGLPPIEAMGCGCAVITSNSGGVNEYAIPNINCLMFTPKRVTELTQCLKSLIADEQLRLKLSLAGQETAKVFNWDRSTKQLLDIISC